jgi:ribosome-binding protein aMBF1 (putative translation factor)
MSDLDKYVEGRKTKSPAFAEGYDAGYDDFKFGIMLKNLRESRGMTQEDLAERLKTKKSVISRMENHGTDVRLSTIMRVAAVFGKKVQIAVQ